MPLPAASNDQRALRADPIAVVSEDGGADWPANEADEIGAECRNVPVNGSWFGKEQFRKDQAGGSAIDKESYHSI